MTKKGTCPLTTGQIVDEYFIENRTRLLELAAFLERIDRSADGGDARGDFRMTRSIRRFISFLIDPWTKWIRFSSFSANLPQTLEKNSTSRVQAAHGIRRRRWRNVLHRNARAHGLAHD